MLKFRFPFQVRPTKRCVSALLFFAACTLLLSACTPRVIREQAQNEIRAGEYEHALNTLRKGLDKFPLDPLLTAGERSTREEVAARLFSKAAAQRNAGDFDGAEKSYREAIRLNVAADRAQALIAEVERDRRAAAALADAKQYAAQNNPEKALRRVREGLRDQPRSAELQALERRLEADAYRREEQRQSSLADVRPISLEMRDANLKSIFDVLSRETKINFVLDKDIRSDARATLYLRQTKLDEALDLLLSTNNLNKKVIDPSTVQIYPNTPDKNREYQELVLRTFFLANADPKQAAALLKTLVKIREPFIDEKLNLIVLRDTADNIRLAEKVLAVYDQSEPEVMMEVEVLEISSSRLSELGLRLPDAVTLSVVPPTGGLTLEGLKDIGAGQIGVSPLSATLNLKNQSGDFTILANPRIRAKSREKAKILVGDKLPVITTTSTTAGFVSESVQYVDVGIKVELEPVVTLDNEVTVKVNLEVSSMTQQVKTAGGSLAYQIGTRNATTTLKLADGETQVLAGLINNNERSDANKIPVVGEFPLVGRLFSSNQEEGKRTEIVLSITPRVLRNIQRPHPGAAEFYTGTEGAARLRPVRADTPAGAAATGGSVATSAAGKPQAGAEASAAEASSAVSTITTAAQSEARVLSAILKQQAEVSAKPGETFKVPLSVSTEAELRGLPMQIEYDAKLLELVDVEEGAFLKQGGAQTTFVRSGAASDGRVSISMLRNATQGATGEGIVATVSFKARAAGETSIKVGQATALSADPAITVTAPSPAPTRVRIK